jgi:hypothetical protein
MRGLDPRILFAAGRKDRRIKSGDDDMGSIQRGDGGPLLLIIRGLDPRIFFAAGRKDRRIKFGDDEVSDGVRNEGGRYAPMAVQSASSSS